MRKLILIVLYPGPPGVWRVYSIGFVHRTIARRATTRIRVVSSVTAVYKSDWRSVVNSVEGEHPNYPGASRTLGAVASNLPQNVKWLVFSDA